MINCHTPGIITMMTEEKKFGEAVRPTRKPAAKLVTVTKSDVCAQLRRLEQW